MKKELLIRLIIVITIILLTVFIDQITKFLISKNMELYSFKSVIPGILNFRYITNYGFLLGIGSNLNDGRTLNGVVIITIVALMVLLGYFFYIFFQNSTSKFLLITFSILIGGAWGNFLDRLIKGKVIDFLEFVLPFKRIGRYYIGSTPIFNMADFFVSAGIILLLIYYFIIEPKEHNKKKDEDIKENTISEEGEISEDNQLSEEENKDDEDKIIEN
ncbi:MAG: signal peptidase II [Exilispira sp.]